MQSSRNPYAPPRASVENAAPSTGEIPPNPAVERACTLFWVSYGVGVIAEVVEWVRLMNSDHWFAMVIGSLIALAILYLFTWWITRKLRAGRNWMRWFITILNIAFIPAVVIYWDFFAPLFRAYAENVVAAVFAGLQTLIGTVALVLLFTRPAREWFASQARA